MCLSKVKAKTTKPDAAEHCTCRFKLMSNEDKTGELVDYICERLRWDCMDLGIISLTPLRSLHDVSIPTSGPCEGWANVPKI